MIKINKSAHEFKIYFVIAFFFLPESYCYSTAGFKGRRGRKV